MGRNKQETFFVMDILKFVFCIFVIALHCGIFSTKETLYYWIEKGLFRLAVPYFMLCSGFLFAKKLEENPGDIKKCTVHFSKRLLKMLLVFEPLSIVLQGILFVLDGESGFSIACNIIQSVVFYPFGALWYIQAILVGVWILYFFHVKGVPSKAIDIISTILFLIALVCNSYYFVIENTAIAAVVNGYLRIAVSSRNGVFYGLFMVWMGMKVYRFHRKAHMDSRTLLLGVLFCYGLYLVELWLLMGKTMKGDGSLFVMLIPTSALLLLFSANFKSMNRKTVLLRNLSTGMYLLHRQVLYVLTIVGKLLAVSIPYKVQFAMVALLSMMICCVAYQKAPRIARLLK